MSSGYLFNNDVWFQAIKSGGNHMSDRKDAKSRRNYLVKCTCPNCSQDSEHSFSRVQKGAQLICPYCHKLFQTTAKNAA
jgi:aspartate carbamoyltransferase regulatory subunit